MNSGKAGRIVWHDLFTADRPRSMSFYEGVAGWTYRTEHATRFAWGGGKRDFVLALSENEAGAGFAETPAGHEDGWIAYVEVKDVDATAALAAKLGGAIVKPPFEVPGVGRNSLLRDPLGVLVGISFSRHNFPLPVRQFGVERYLCEATAFPDRFYAELFGWKISSLGGEQPGSVITAPSGEDVAVHLVGNTQSDANANWVPGIKVAQPHASLSEAVAMGGEPLNLLSQVSENGHGAFLRDPNGALLCLLNAQV